MPIVDSLINSSFSHQLREKPNENKQTVDLEKNHSSNHDTWMDRMKMLYISSLGAEWARMINDDDT